MGKYISLKAYSNEQIKIELKVDFNNQWTFKYKDLIQTLKCDNSKNPPYETDPKSADSLKESVYGWSIVFTNSSTAKLAAKITLTWNVLVNGDYTQFAIYENDLEINGDGASDILTGDGSYLS
jgi:hypothetical protein